MSGGAGRAGEERRQCAHARSFSFCALAIRLSCTSRSRRSWVYSACGTLTTPPIFDCLATDRSRDAARAPERPSCEAVAAAACNAEASDRERARADSSEAMVD